GTGGKLRELTISCLHSFCHVLVLFVNVLDSFFAFHCSEAKLIDTLAKPSVHSFTALGFISEVVLLVYFTCVVSYRKGGLPVLFACCSWSSFSYIPDEAYEALTPILGLLFGTMVNDQEVLGEAGDLFAGKLRFVYALWGGATRKRFEEDKGKKRVWEGGSSII
ncbi:hypothetical protein HPP92_028002, partial [Vanilla planifolia]